MNDHPLGHGPDLLDVVGPILAILGVGGYLGLVATRGKKWPRRRSWLWVTGSVAAAAAVSGPLAEAAETSYVAHMVAHLLLGMLAPVLLVLAGPVSLLLRSLPPSAARRVSHLLRSRPLRLLTEPVVAAVLNVGALWGLYTTGLYPAMHHRPVVHVLVHAHMFVAGYLLALALIGVDPMPHRRSFLHRSTVLVLALAVHDILAKYLYAHPPVGTDLIDGHTGAMVMYYGGDAVDLALMVLLCARWYRTARPRQSVVLPEPRGARVSKT